MARYDFTNDSGMLKIVLQTAGGLYDPPNQNMSLSTPSVSLTVGLIKLFDAGKYRDTYGINDIGLIKGTPYTDITLAFNALSILISEVMRTQGGGTLIP